jgi:bifunctional non-homologous end joining protein LigD
MKAQLVDSIRPGDWLYEIKFDGYRALALRGGRETRILSRNQKDLGKFPEIVDSIAALDGLEGKRSICTRARPNRIRIN